MILFFKLEDILDASHMQQIKEQSSSESPGRLTSPHTSGTQAVPDQDESYHFTFTKSDPDAARLPQAAKDAMSDAQIQRYGLMGMVSPSFPSATSCI